MWARRSFGMILHPENRQVTVSKALYRPVIEGYMSDFQVTGSRHRAIITFNGETMILGCDQHSPGLDLLHRMIPPSMTVGHLDGRTAECQSQELMAEADPKDRHAVRGQRSNYRSTERFHPDLRQARLPLA